MLFITLHCFTGRNYNTHRCELLVEVGGPSLFVRRDAHWVLIIFRALTGFNPVAVCLCCLFTWALIKQAQMTAGAFTELALPAVLVLADSSEIKISIDLTFFRWPQTRLQMKNDTVALRLLDV